MASISSLGIGSGLDLNGLLDQLKDAERGKLEPIERQLESQQTRISAYGQLKSGLSSFQSAIGKLNDTSMYESLSTSVSGESVSATADETAMPGSYNITVDTLATRGTLASDGVGDTETAISGTDDQVMTFTFGYGDTSTTTGVSIAANSSLEAIRDAINADESAGVDATIINDGSDGTNYRLALSSRETGADASISNFSFNIAAPFAADGGVNVDDGSSTGTHQAGTDASLNVNGVTITSTSNQVEGAIQGVTLNLQEGGGATSSVVVEQDTLAVREAVTGFVKAFNDLKGSIGELTAFNSETGQAGDLLGDNTVRTVESRLRGVLGGGVAEGQFSMLSNVGISMQLDGTLEIDNDKLDDVIANDQGALAEFFAGTSDETGMAGKLDTTLSQLLGTNGAVQGAISGAESSIESLGNRYTSMEQSIDRTIDRYRTQFGQLDGMIAQMNSTSSYLTQQFDALDAQLGRD
ncbi:flagellar filament capping protein FliD [Vreelandella rituensis]|uniref:Flagellar hook-associated protein 2 n=1 Tax=Vreelandella rituensis TaxID=2282306 RepID=A0A368TZ47_9GAMM|nr:flagellar filament capping protein FliD [Halomonas rituensis]RCV89606.1 flagellar hook protein [Halomonas rituensis]